MWNSITMRRQNPGRNKEDWAEALRKKTVVCEKELFLCGQSLVLPDNQLSWPPNCLNDSERG